MQAIVPNLIWIGLCAQTSQTMRRQNPDNEFRLFTRFLCRPSRAVLDCKRTNYDGPQSNTHYNTQIFYFISFFIISLESLSPINYAKTIVFSFLLPALFIYLYKIPIVVKILRNSASIIYDICIISKSVLSVSFLYFNDKYIILYVIYFSIIAEK